MDNGSEDALKTYDNLVSTFYFFFWDLKAYVRHKLNKHTHKYLRPCQVLTSLMGGARRVRSFRQLLMVLFYRLSIFDAMEDEVESEHAFAALGLAIVFSFGGLFVLFLVCAVWYIVDTALGWRFTSALVPLI